MTSLRKTAVVILSICALYLFNASHSVHAQQSATPIQCGQIIESEFLPDNLTHAYSIYLEPGDTLTVETRSVGDILISAMRVTDSENNQIAPNHEGTRFTTPAVSARGDYRITVYSRKEPWRSYNWDTNYTGGIYTLYVGCTRRDGTVISPGDFVNPEINQIPTLDFHAPSFGFAGLAPVDFANVVPFSIPVGVPMTGGITPSGGEILGYLVSGNEGDVLELHFTRLSGNLNLGLIVLSQNNELAFQASLITTNSLTAQLSLPSTGDYTVGVFRVDLLPPDTPQPTTFQIQAVVNP